MMAAWMMSERLLICSSPNMILSIAKTRSHMAELGEMAKATLAASAHAGKVLPFVRHHVSTEAVNASTSDLSNMGALLAAAR